MKRRIAVITTSRADYGHLYWPLRDLSEHDQVDLKIVALGSHLSPEFGNTIQEIERDGFQVDARIECLLSSDSDVGMAKTIGVATLSLSDLFGQMRPDLILLIADRYEMLAPASVALALRIPLAHIEGGEISEGAIDDAVRNALTMMSHIHFTSTQAARQRVISMGEEEWRVHRAGAPSLDHLRRRTLFNREQVESRLGIDLQQPTILVVYHPVTIARDTVQEADALFAALDQISDQILFCYPNADAGSRALIGRTETFLAARKQGRVFVNLDVLTYWSLLRHVELLLGNSSSGIMETASFALPTVNVGLRQQGRERARNVLDAAPEAEAILKAIRIARSPEFRRSLEGMENPYGDGFASEKIVKVLTTVPLSQDLLMKRHPPTPVPVGLGRASAEVRIPLSSPDIGEAEIEAVARVLRSARLSQGPKLEEFEEAVGGYVGAAHAVAVSSGTSGLHLCIRALGIGEGDEVIVPSFAFISVANVVRYEKAVPVFVDIDPETLNLDPERIEAAITPRCRAILVVHTCGCPAKLAAILEIARKHRLFVIEDACEAIGAEYEGRKVGPLGDAGVFAFYPNKQITTGEGGVIVTQNPELAVLARKLRNQGRSHSREWFAHGEFGYNYRISEVNCALGVEQMKRLDHILDRREAIARAYHQRLHGHPDLKLPALRLPLLRISWFAYLIRLSDRLSQFHRDWMVKQMLSRGIECGRYFAPIHLQPIYRAESYQRHKLPATEWNAARTLALPLFNRMEPAQIDEVCQSLQELIGRASALESKELISEKI
jgi:UDP-hydrolysing UDP-N-acetyl-D-glucosamine 2-epimerase